MSDEDEGRLQDQQDESDGQNGQGQQDQQGQQNQQNQQGQGGQQNEESSTAEKVLTGISVVFTVLLFSYVAWQAVQQPVGAHPQAEVVGTEQLSNGSVAVRVQLTNPGNVGLISATVEANCDRPPPDTMFEYVPASGREQGILVCPPGTTRPDVSVSSWVPA